MSLMPLPEAVSRILETVRLQPAEPCSVPDALGRVLACDVHAPIDVPPWDCSAMDGYAVRAVDTVGADARLRINEVVPAGRAPQLAVAPGTATVIMTGAPMPEGADAVVIVEDSDGARGDHVRLRAAVAAGENVRPRGDDLRQGALVLGVGTVLGPAALGLLASLGLVSVAVARRPRVAVLTTGDELVAPGAQLRPGAIYSSNDLTIASLVVEAGAVVQRRAHAPDDPDALTAALEACLEADVVVTTGGVSVGDHDHVKEVLARVGAELRFWKVAMKPGKPLAFGVARPPGREVPIFGLPGNPVSCFVNFLQFVRPWLRASMGDRRPFLPVVPCVAGEDMRARPGRARLERVALTVGPEGWIARRSGNQSSGVLSAVANAHGLLLVGAEEEGPSAGEPVQVQLFDPGFLHGAEPGYGW
jgi:molybdopterin molybdotransferase